MKRKQSAAAAAILLLLLAFQEGSFYRGFSEGADTQNVPASEFAPNAFPPTVSDVEHHRDASMRNDCLRCHETGVQGATVVKHEGMPDVLLTAKCRSCHILIPGQAPAPPKQPDQESAFADFAFPPMMPASVSHQDAWTKDNCLLCHETGSVRGAPAVKHRDLPRLLLKAKCRSCHVQVRSAFPSE